MYAIVEISGKQYQAVPKQVIEVNKIDKQENEKITLDKVLLFSDGKKVEVGQPYLKGISVEAEVLKQLKGRKIVAFTFKRRKNEYTKIGSRAHLTKLLITKISK